MTTDTRFLEYLRTVLETVRDAIVCADRFGDIKYCNRATEVTFGYGAGELLGVPLTQLMPARFHDAHRAGLARFLATKEPQVLGSTAELVGLRRDATEFPIELALSAGQVDQELFVTGIIRDITERQRVETEARRAERSYRRVIETTREGIFATDAENHITFVNPRIQELLGYPAGTMIGMSAFALLDDEARAVVAENLARRRRGVGDGGDLRMRHRDGHDIWVHYEGTPLMGEDGAYQGVFVMVLDISERRRAAESLRLSEARLRQAQAIASVGSWDWDLTTNVMTRSEELTRILGLGDGEPEVTLFEMIDPEDRERVDQDLQRTIHARVPLVSDFRIRRGDLVRYLHIRGECFADERQRLRLIGTAQDVTEKREVEARLLLADRMASVGTLAAGVAHEINNPLSYVMTNLEMIAEEVRDLAGGSPSARMRELEELTNEAREGAERVRRIVRGLKTFSRADVEQRLPLDVRRVIDLAINMAFIEIRHRARLVKDYGEVPAVEADDSRLGQVFVNLLINAAHAIPEGRVDHNEIRVVTSTDSRGRALIEVRDTGHGIPSSLIGRIFDPFFTTKAVGVGTGLGLSICHSLVTALSGELTVESQVGHGSVFRVALPPARADERSPQVRLEPAARTVRSGRVLVVDDDVVLGGMMKRILRPNEVIVATTGRQALELLRTGACFDVILCDLMMPEMTGMELYAVLAEELPEQLERIVFVTGGAFTQSARGFLDGVPNERVEKPFAPQSMRALVQRWLR